MKQDDVHLTGEVSENVDETDHKPATMNATNKSDDDITNNSNTKTDDNRSNNGLNRSEDSSIGSTTSLNKKINSEPNPSGGNQDDTKSSSTTSSAQYSINENSETSEPKRTIINKYVKKVKNLMKPK